MNRYMVRVDHNDSFVGEPNTLVMVSSQFQVLARTKIEAVISAFDQAADLSLSVVEIHEPEFVGEA